MATGRDAAAHHAGSHGHFFLSQQGLVGAAFTLLGTVIMMGAWTIPPGPTVLALAAVAVAGLILTRVVRAPVVAGCALAAFAGIVFVWAPLAMAIDSLAAVSVQAVAGAASFILGLLVLVGKW